MTPQGNFISTDEYAEILRNWMTPAEQMIWPLLRKIGFKSQVPVGRYIADFASPCRKVIVEIDGQYHRDPAAAARDAKRDAWLKSQGWKVMRFGNATVGTDPKRCAELIRHEAMKRPRLQKAPFLHPFL